MAITKSVGANKAVTINVNVASVAANSSVDTVLTYKSAKIGQMLVVNPATALAAGLSASASIVVNGQILLRINNNTAGAIDPPAMDYRFMFI